MKKKLFIKIWIIISIVAIVSFSDWSFAADEEPIRNFAYYINYFTQIFSRIWVIFAKIAWEFLTNKRVYWEIIWLDALLWKYWVVVRNIANFWLWLFFTYTVLMALFKKEDILKDLKNTLLRLLIAWIWIQISRFVTAVVMDASTVTLVSVWSLPSQVISKNQELNENFKRPIRDFLTWNVVLSWEEIVLFPQNAAVNTFLQQHKVTIEARDGVITKEQFFDDLLPKYDNVSWPLYYMWIAILDAFSISEIPVADTGKSWWERTILNVIINWWTTIVFSIEMMVLCIVAILRIFYLWMFIALSPLVVLFYCIEKADKQWVWDFMKNSFKSFNDNLNLNSFFINAFKPAIIVLWISLSVIFMATMKWVIIDRDNGGESVDFQWVSMSSHCVQVNKCDTKVDSELFAWVFKNLSKTLMNFILSIITVILVYNIIKISVNIGKWDDFVSQKIGNLQKSIGDLMSSAPIIPITWRDENWEPKTGHISFKKALTIPEQKLIREQTKFEEKRRTQSDEIVESFFGETNTLTQSQEGKIERAWQGKNGWQALLDKLDAIKQVRTERKNKKWWMVLNPKSSYWFWREQFTDWLNERVDKKDTNYIPQTPQWIVRKNMITEWEKLNQDKDKRKLEDLFNKRQNFVQAYVEFFLDSGDARRSIRTRWDLINLDISTVETSWWTSWWASWWWAGWWWAWWWAGWWWAWWWAGWWWAWWWAGWWTWWGI